MGAALTHPYITTDYSEALLEFITPPSPEASAPLDFLRDVEKFVYARLDNEILWASSMPCVLAGGESIPVARYGRSNAGMMKMVYRRGLGYRYGKMMQVIAGVHFNFSVPEAFWPVLQQMEQDPGDLQAFINARYLAMIRNLQRVGWLITYLFGCSPTVCKSFMDGLHTALPEFNANTFYEPYATSLRMGDIGYQNNREGEVGIKACYDDLDSYIASLRCAIQTPCEEYARIGVKVDGEYRQLNANILQIENEYYTTVRPKQILDDNEKPTLALKRRGIRYVELRSLDLNAFEPLGINEDQVYFLEAFMLYCLLADSPPIGRAEADEIDANQNAVAHRGRAPGMRLRRNGAELALRNWAVEVAEAMVDICALLDEGQAQMPYTQALGVQRAAIEDPELTPSARMLQQMRENREGFYHFTMRMSQKHKRYFDTLTLSPEREAFFQTEAMASVQRQRAMEDADSENFDDYLAHYLDQP